MSKKLLEMAAEIVQNQLAGNPLSTEEIITSLRQVFDTLQEMQEFEAQECVVEFGKSSGSADFESHAIQKMDPANSIQKDKIICLECGAEMRQLTVRHLMGHGLGLTEYKQKYGLPLRQPLVAISLSKARSKAAKKRGLPENLKKYLEEKRGKKSGNPPRENPAPTALN